MSEAVKKLTDEQVEFIESELGISADRRAELDENALYDDVYAPCCDIEEVEVVKTIDNGSELSDRGRIAADIVTALGNAID